MSFLCHACGRIEPRWLIQCPGCEKWKSFGSVEIDEGQHRVSATPDATGVVDPIEGRLARFAQNRPAPILVTQQSELASEPIEFAPPSPIRITDVEDDDLERTLTELEPLDRVLGGGLVTASVVLLGGEPGCGKSTLCAKAISSVGQRVLYVTGEETIEQATMRARRVDATHPEIWIVASNDVDETIECAKQLAPAILTVDSIQTLSCRDVGGAPGSISQVRECALRLSRYAKTHGVTVIIVGHVTKDGALAGPNTLKHLVDVVLRLEVSEFGNRRTLHADKNRFGSTQEVGVFEMTADGMIAVEQEAVGQSLVEIARTLAPTQPDGPALPDQGGPS